MGVRGQFASGGGARGRGRDGVGWRARRVRAVAGGAGDASEASGSPARVLDADAARVLFPTRKAKPCRRRFRESDRCVGAIDAGNARAPFGWGTYVVDVRDDGHVTDVVLLVHLTTELVDRELRGEGERWRSGRRLALGLLASRNGGKSICRDIIGPGFGASGRHARWVETRERALASARDAPSPWLQEFNCRHGYSPGASNRGGAMPIDGPFIADAIQPPRKSRNIHSTAHPVTEKLSLKIQNLRTEIHHRSCGASDFLRCLFLRVAARRESLGPR